MVNKESEGWVYILGYKYYLISSFGRVKSLERQVKHNYGGLRTIKEKFLKFSINEDGYYIVTLTQDSKSKTFLIHRLVCSAFHPNPENKPEVNHKDCDKLNNYKTNVEWNTRLENMKHAWDSGRIIRPQGISSPNYGKTGSLCFNSKKVINTETGEIFDSIKLAQGNIGITNLADKLRGVTKNNTNLKYYKDENQS